MDGWHEGILVLTGELIIGETIDYDNLLTGKRRESMYSGVRMVPNIFLDNIAAAVGLGFLGMLGFKSEVDPDTDLLVHNNEACMIYLRVMNNLVPSLGMFLAAYLMRYYHLDADTHKQILSQIHR